MIVISVGRERKRKCDRGMVPLRVGVYEGRYRYTRVAARAYVGGGSPHGCRIPRIVLHDLALGGSVGIVISVLVAIVKGLRLILLSLLWSRCIAGAGHHKSLV